MSNAGKESPFAAGSHGDSPPPPAAPVWANIETMPSLSPLAGVVMWPLSGNNLMLNFVRIEPNAVVPLHHHPHEQGGTVLEGSIIMTIDGETRELRAGDAYIAPPHSVHGARGGAEGCLVVDIFSPPREDYILPATK